ncbi:diacylglycerol/lipid kinase family protein [Pseudomonas sp. Root562]|uniref:diacylglycerol/lipid kinase family protein n=1 Tax=Pseudomonas sp. Root562 TaxID=1736561 RepID=UPI000AE4B39B|nr:acylglycerol kinase family protein [Pseudomonas sp. Root562]
MMRDACPRPQKIGILLNPCSGTLRRALPRFRLLARDVPGASVLEATSADEIADAVCDFQLRESDLLVVVGGDGTLQAAISFLLSQEPACLPTVLVIPGGTTNMSAIDLGARLSAEKALTGLSAWLAGDATAAKVVSRAALRVDSGLQHAAQFGMFFGVGAVVNGVRYYHRTLRPKRVPGALGPTLALGRMLFSALHNLPHDLFCALPARLGTHRGVWERDWLVVFATTLDRLLAGSRPYWGTEPQPIHLTAIAHRPRRLALVLPLLLWGRAVSLIKEQDGYFSHNFTRMDLGGADEYVLDGEIFPAQGTITLAATAPIRFMTF